jgi:hypothetical protein
MDECGDPRRENMAWTRVDGVAEQVIDGSAFLFRDASGRSFRMAIANVSPRATASGVRLLKAAIEHRRVTVLISKLEGYNITGVVLDDLFRDVAVVILSVGGSTFVPAPAYTLSAYSECVHRIAEREARRNHMGVWSHDWQFLPKE